ncbi:unnamed protein product [Rangifer tarandus platyrhynchus]|uniref:Uncharacterized protein n=2 Tax=Rangifer tarandus platyrhynchus TaxID=3082113 RepID=A0ACB0EEM8_RANTA|nr:unnamed protein product [Rangifer tarandus platyrhynchus]CAI9698729.1 unnamed protein product [Rangifer tarandus platyrhynchus]
MSGHAGRCGEDLTGNIFFYNIPLPKTEWLLRSNVSKLKGQFPLSLSLVLRRMLLVAKADDKDDAKAKALSVLQCSLMSFKQPNIKCMLKFYFIYSLQFLVTEVSLLELVSRDQEYLTTGYSGLVPHLHYHEPSKFVLVSLLVKGLFHKLCVPADNKGQKTFSEDIMETLIFFHSVVVLKGLPEDFASEVEERNDSVQKNAVSFLLTISKLADTRKDCQRPLSEIDDTTLMAESEELNSLLMKGYVLNFYKHGSLPALTEDNWLNMGDGFQFIGGLALVTWAIGTSVSELCEDEDSCVVLAFKQLGDAFNGKLGRKERP